MTVLYLSASTDAVDASLFTKRDAVLRFIESESLDPGCIGAIGDSENDLPSPEFDRDARRGAGRIHAVFRSHAVQSYPSHHQ